MPRQVTMLDLLYQDEIWVDKVKQEWRLSEIKPDHRRNLLALLERQAPRLKSMAEWSMVLGPQPSGEMASDAFDGELDRMMSQSPDAWLNELPLVQKLRKLERKYNKPKNVRKRRLAEADLAVRQQNGWDR